MTRFILRAYDPLVEECFKTGERTSDEVFIGRSLDLTLRERPEVNEQGPTGE